MDNASNNNTMMREISSLLSEREIVFDAVDLRVMCYAHVVDLASGRVIKKSRESAGDSDSDSDSDSDLDDTHSRDPITLGRNVVRVIRASNARRDSFDAVIVNGNSKHLFKQGQPPKPVTLEKLQLLRMVPTRWDSVYYMLRRLRELKPVSPSSFDLFSLLIPPI